MAALDLEDIAKTAARAADRARDETLSRFRKVSVETKADGSPVTEADRAAERCIRETLLADYPDFALLGEEYGGQGIETGSSPLDSDRPVWVVDPIDGTIAYARGLPLYSTLIALVHGGESVFGLIDLPALGERYVGWKGGGCRRNGEPVAVSQETDLKKALVSHGDPMCFDRAGRRAAFNRMAAEVPILRGYTDAFGHSQVLSGGVDAMVDADLNPWDAAASQVLVAEAGGRCVTRPDPSGKLTLVLGSPALVEQLAGWLEG